MDTRKKFNIKRVKQYYHNIETDQILEYDASVIYKIKFIKKLIEELIYDPGIHGEIKYIDKDNLEEKKLIKINQKYFRVEELIMPLLISWAFYKDEEENLFLNISISINNCSINYLKNFWFECLCNIEKVKNYLIYPLIFFDLNIYFIFEDGGEIFVNIDNNYEINNIEIEIKSPQAEYFMENHSWQDIKNLIY